MTALSHLPAACGLRSCGTATLERTERTGEVNDYNEPLTSITKFDVDLLAPIGLEQLAEQHETADRNRTVERWRFFIIPPAPLKNGQRIVYGSDCFSVVAVNPIPTSCCGTTKLHHYEVEAERVTG